MVSAKWPFATRPPAGGGEERKQAPTFGAFFSESTSQKQKISLFKNNNQKAQNTSQKAK